MLYTARLILRQWRDNDLPEFAALNSDPEVMRFFAEPLSRQKSDAYAERIRRHIDEHGWGLWAVEVRELAAFIGFVGLSAPAFEAHFTPCIEVGWRVARAFWGMGYATEAARVVLAHGFGSLTLREIVSYTYTENWRSRAVMERLGMTHNPADDFEHPKLDKDHPLRHQVLYRITTASQAVVEKTAEGVLAAPAAGRCVRDATV